MQQLKLLLPLMTLSRHTVATLSRHRVVRPHTLYVVYARVPALTSTQPRFPSNRTCHTKLSCIPNFSGVISLHRI